MFLIRSGAMLLDSHQHFWKYDPVQYPWIPRGSALQRDWMPEDLAPHLQTAGLDGSIAVQARQSIEETRWLLKLADESPRIKGVVGWVDLRHERVEEQLAEFASHPKFVGVRHVVQDEPDDRFLCGREFQRGIGKLRQFQLRYDLLIYPKQLPAALELVAKFPDQPFVLDHIAKPPIREGALAPWRELIRQLAQAAPVTCKVSGLITEARHGAWQAADFRPYLDVVCEAFGPGRLMYGSDWPVCLLSGSYAQAHQLVMDYAAPWPESSRAELFGQVCRSFYGV